MSMLTLTVLRCPDSAVSQQRQVQGGELTIGRGAECDWQLADPDRLLSKKHCALEFYAGGWQVRDLSTNGTFVNAGTPPIGRDQVRPLFDGDRLRLGPYELEVRIESETAGADAPFGWGAQPAPPLNPPPASGPGGLPGFNQQYPGQGIPGTPSLPDDDSFLSETDAPMPDHSYATSDAFLPRPVLPAGKSLIPDDWDLDIGPQAGPAPPAAPVPPIPFERFEAAPATASPAPSPPLPTPVRLEPISEPAEVAPPLTQSPIRPPRMPVSPVAATAPQDEGAAALAALAALLAGANLTTPLSPRALSDPDAALRNAGALLRSAAAGLRALLIARSDVKREFRIEQTVLRVTDNNPLKFAASDEQALLALLDPNSGALRAMQETVDDLKTHQIATLAATQAAARALLDRLAPSQLEAEDAGGGLLPGAREKRLWEAYRRRHAQLIEQFEDDFESAFGKAFARAYELAAGRLSD